MSTMLLATGWGLSDIWDWLRTTCGYGVPGSEFTSAAECLPDMANVYVLSKYKEKYLNALKGTDQKAIDKAYADYMDAQQKMLKCNDPSKTGVTGPSGPTSPTSPSGSTGPMPLHATELPLDTVKSSTARLDEAMLREFLQVAGLRWAATGVNVTGLDKIEIRVGNLADGVLGLAFSKDRVIEIDDDAAGFGWFVDSTPTDDVEFSQLHANGDAAVKFDLLSVVTHELGHLLGFAHVEDDDDVMGATLAAGSRHLPDLHDEHSHASNGVELPLRLANPRSIQSIPTDLNLQLPLLDGSRNAIVSAMRRVEYALVEVTRLRNPSPFGDAIRSPAEEPEANRSRTTPVDRSLVRVGPVTTAVRSGGVKDAGGSGGQSLDLTLGAGAELQADITGAIGLSKLFSHE